MCPYFKYFTESIRRIINQMLVPRRIEGLDQTSSENKLFNKAIHRKHLFRSIFFDKVADCWLATWLQRGSSVDVFLRVLQNFIKQLFSWTPMNSGFWKDILPKGTNLLQVSYYKRSGGKFPWKTVRQFSSGCFCQL